ncbi:MAG: type 2 isopentenyl-diphosphate Delta-isomerase [Balneolaceae bacterium]
MSIQKRKKEHVDLTLNRDVFYHKSTGFERYDFVHNALPEVNYEEVDLAKSFLGRSFSYPLFISSMTGGYSEAGAVNAKLASFCERRNLPFGVGSQRAMLEHPDQLESFSVVRKHAPTAFIAANIGGAQLIGGLKKRSVELLEKSLRADAIIVHLNPLQELMQPEGDLNFFGIKEGISKLIEQSSCPIIVKETGAGISFKTANELLELGVDVIDVAGAGGTSWAKVENLRERTIQPMHQFDDWGIPTAICVKEIYNLKEHYSFELIASGGIRTSFDIAKSIALGADFSATAQPIIKAIFDQNEDALDTLLNLWMKESRILLTLLGCSTFDELNQSHLRPV